ncbi:formylglycine-generating enzyme family protein [Solimonas marina]|uniref:Formylglycine-generating enzyme family protein n=1 Tax=Solimonas marina TaxID=2714601 RepID=A0A969W6H2_9GAMM|nr:SUMF1/EgtB/PvdO family nonheme iron enzyme [Solimonas marina]NKF20833.1 formylglycine-generating enzyme family protein [Solimonas marina]
MKWRVLAASAAVMFAAVAVLCARHEALPPASPTAVLGTPQRCAAYDGLPPGSGRHAGMQYIAGGRFELGSLRGYAEERPLVSTDLAPFWIDRTEVTNAQFARFVAATGYVSDAERHDGAVVFSVPDANDTADLAAGRWWHLRHDANWRKPDGAAAAAANEPVVDVTYADALAYARWLGRELPSEAQWEFAAKAGRDNADADRALRDAQGHPLANFWQGLFPFNDRGDDGYTGRAPVGCFAANPDGLYDMVGNVWEWTTDRYRDRHAPAEEAEAAAVMPARGSAPRRVIKGGSYLCAANYCARARASSRQGQEADLPSEHVGFRTVAPT